MAQPKRKNWERSTTTSFKKTYGQWVYSFRHELNEVPGYTSVLITVKRKKEGDSTRHFGELVHGILWQKEED